jgi:hypothetical protein
MSYESVVESARSRGRLRDGISITLLALALASVCIKAHANPGAMCMHRADCSEHEVCLADGDLSEHGHCARIRVLP